MKKLLILISAFASANIFAQSTVQLLDNGVILAPNATISAVTTANNNTKVYIDIKNIGSTNNSYTVKRYDVLLNAAGGATASAYFCFAGQCFDASTKAGGPLALTPGQSASQVPGSFNMLTSDLDEAGAVGISIVKYTFFNSAQTNDSAQVTLKYNAPAGINESANLFSSFELSPNPVNDVATLKINCSKATDSRLCVYNALGAIVSEKMVSLNEGKNKIDFSAESLPSGVYFASLKSANATTTKKFIVR